MRKGTKVRLLAALLGVWVASVALQPALAQTTAAPQAAGVPLANRAVPVIGVEDDWAPFAWLDKAGEGPRGYTVEVVREAFREAGVAVQLSAMPFGRCMHESRTGKIVGCLNSIFNDETRSAYLLPAMHLVNEPLAVLARAAAPREQIDAKTLEGRTVGYVQSYHYPDWFMNNAAIVRVPAGSDVALLRMLDRGRVEFAMYGATAASWRLQVEPELRDVRLRMVGQLSNDGFGLVFSRNHPQAEGLRRDFERGMRKLQSGNVLRELQRRHLPPPLSTE